jgi:hypothetical protein
MAALNCVMLSPTGDPVPLPSEKFLFSSRTRTVSISLFARPPGADFSVQPKRGQEYKQNHGTLHVSQKRIVYVAAGAATASASIGPTSGAAAGSLALGQASIAPGAISPDKVPLMTLSIPLRYFIDGHLVQPWFGANYYEALCIDGDGAGDLTVRDAPTLLSTDSRSLTGARSPPGPTHHPIVLQRRRRVRILHGRRRGQSPRRTAPPQSRSRYPRRATS